MQPLEIHDVSVRLGRVQALEDVAISLGPGRVVMLVGPNGAGKSTLIKVLLGLVRPDAASFRRGDKPVAIDNDWKRRLGYLPEAVAFSENLTAQQVVRFFARARDVPMERVGEVLEQVGLASESRRAIRGYSRGMRQRLGLGIAILAEPDLLLLDEPTAGLDQQGLEVLWSIVREWRETGRTVLVSSHDLALMERHVDEIRILRGGRVVAAGTAEELRELAALPCRIWLEVADDREERVIALCDALARRAPDGVERVGDRIRADVGSGAVIEVLEVLSRFPGVAVGVRIEEPTLDVVYTRILRSA